MYAIYLRKSRKDHDYENAGEVETLARHETALLELAKKNGYAIGEIYREVVSGETIEARPEMKKLLQAVEAGLYEGVLVMEVERLARGNTKDQGIVSEAFCYSNTLIITPSKIYDPSNEFDEEYFEFGLFMSRREYKAINRRIQRGRIASVKEGKYIAKSVPYGYNKIKLQGTKGWTLEPNEDADIVRLIFKLYTEDKIGGYSIASQLDAMGVKPVQADYWRRTSIKKILKNPVYTGKVRWQWRKVVKTMENGKIVEHRTEGKPGEYILVDGLHPPIISQETFDLAQKIMASRSIASVNHNRDLVNPLSGILYCEKCGSLMRAAHPRVGRVLLCSNRYCDNVMNKLAPVEEEVINAIKDWFEDYKINFADKYHKQDLSSQHAIIKSCQDKLKTLNKQLSNTYTLLEQGVYTVDVFKNRSSVIQADIAETTALLEKAKKDLEKLSDVNAVIGSFIPDTGALIESYDKAETPKEKNITLKALIEKATYLKTERGKKGYSAPFTIHIYPKLPEI